MRKKKFEVLSYFEDVTGYCELKEEALDRTVWRTGFERGCGSVVRQTGEWKNQE